MARGLEKQIKQTIDSQRNANKVFRSLIDRKNMIQKLLDWMLKNESRIKVAIQKDFRKPEVEIELTEIWLCIKEARYMLKNLKSWMKKEKVSKSLPLFMANSYIIREPKGAVLIIAPWNYPFQLSVMPLLAAIAAGNSVFLKPSEKTPNVSALIKEMILDLFSQSEVCVFEGGEKTVTHLLNNKFDHILYTGGTKVGQIVMEKASKTLTPVTLELGGKCPVLIDSSSNLAEAAKKIVYYKFMNAGQTCVAPDYVFVDKSVSTDFIKHTIEYIDYIYGEHKTVINNVDYCRLVNKEHTERLNSVLKEALSSGASLEYGGECDIQKCYMSPTIIKASFRSSIMKEEIFGPILPIIEYDNFDNAIDDINKIDSPLAAYIFSNKKNRINQFIQNTQSGAVCINDLSLHLVHEKLPFGGVGKSGIGRYHGKFGFDELSNLRPVIKNIEKSPLKMLHPPYSSKVQKIVKLLRKIT